MLRIWETKVKAVEAEKIQMTEDQKDHRKVKIEGALNNLLGKKIKKIHLHWEGDPWAKVGAGQALKSVYGEELPKCRRGIGDTS